MTARARVTGRSVLAVALVLAAAFKLAQPNDLHGALLTAAVLELAAALALVVAPLLRKACLVAIASAATGAALVTGWTYLRGEPLSHRCGCLTPSTTRAESLVVLGLLIVWSTWLAAAERSPSREVGAMARGAAVR